MTQQRAQGSQSGGINVRGRDEIRAQEVRKLFRIDAIILVLAAVNGAEIERVRQDKSEVGFMTGIGEPESAEHAFGTTVRLWW